MKAFTLDIWEDYSYPGDNGDNFRPTLDAYILKSGAPRPAVLVLPGSGYVQCSPREAEALAVRFNAEGYHAFVLWYSCTPHYHPAPLLDCARALTLIRENAANWSIDSRRVGLMGFSAGGHLALSETIYHKAPFASAPGVTTELARADALMLCYPVVTSGEYAHRGSFDALLGAGPDALPGTLPGTLPDSPALLETLSLEKHISAGMPPVFLWHTVTDDLVPVENSLLLASSLRKAGVPFEAHLFPSGVHGLSLAVPETCDDNPDFINPLAARWFPLCKEWLREVFSF